MRFAKPQQLDFFKSRDLMPEVILKEKKNLNYKKPLIL